MFSSKSCNSYKSCTVLKPIGLQADTETTERIVSDTCRDSFERFKCQKLE